MKNRLTILLGIILISMSGFTQTPFLSIDEAIEIALQNNYNIQVAENNILIAENNTDKFNTGVLPTVSANAGSNYQYSRQKVKIGDNKLAFKGNSFPFSAGVSVNYVLFDKSRKLNIQQLNEFVSIADLQQRQSVENMLVTLITTYYQVTTIERNIAVQKANLSTSNRNLKRAEYAFDYGVATKLGILNSEVNVNNDSILVQSSIVNFENTKRNLNIIMGRDPSITFKTDTTINYVSDFTLEELLNATESNNVQLKLADQNISVEQLNQSLAKTGWLPTINANGAYNWNQNFNLRGTDNTNPAFNSTPSYVVSDGFNGGLNLSWNIFDGGRTKTQIQNSSIAIENTKLFKDEILRQLQRDVYNNWRSYENALFIVTTQEKNIETSERNFERSAEQFKLGNISTTTYREAQTNLLNAQLSYLRALYDAKVLETVLLQLSGNLVSN